MRYYLTGKKRSKTSGEQKNHEWRRPQLVFGVPTSENNVCAILKQFFYMLYYLLNNATLMLHSKVD
jgi:hypothetical protein